MLGEERQHRVEHTRIDRRRRVRIEVDGIHWFRVPSSWLPATGYEVTGYGDASAERRREMEMSTGSVGSVASSVIEQVCSATRMRSLIFQSGSRTLHFEY